MKIVAVIPVKPPGEGKSRLDGVLEPRARADLSRAMFARVLAAVRGSGLDAVVVSRDAAIRAAAEAAGAHGLAETGPGGLLEALDAARVLALRCGADALLVLPADLPWIEAADVRALVDAAAAPAAVVVAPDTAGQGTNALLLAPADAIGFAFGEDSFARHCAAARGAGIDPAVLRRPGLAFDVDTPADLARLQAAATIPEGGVRPVFR